MIRKIKFSPSTFRLRPEQAAQIHVVGWLHLARPDVLFTASVQENTYSFKMRALRMKMGYKAGTPDLQVYEPRGGYHALLIEMKREDGGSTSPEQKAFHEELRKRNYKVEICHGGEEGVEAVKRYLEGR